MRKNSSLSRTSLQRVVFLNPIITWNGYILDGQNTVEARRTCNGGMELPIRCKVFYGLTKEDEATLFAIQTGNATCLTAGERLRANLVAENPDALYFVGITSNAGVEFAYDGIRAPWKIYCIETAYELYKQHGCERYVEMLHIYATWSRISARNREGNALW